MLCARLLVAMVTLAALSACTGKDPFYPGTPLGTFHVVGTLRENSCGAGQAVPDPWEFDIRLARDHQLLYWIQGGPPVAGTLDAEGHASMHAVSINTVHDANPDAGVGACALERDDALDTTLGPDPTTTFTGTLVYTFKVADGSDCADELTSGSFKALPCSASYNLVGTRTSAPAPNK
jgi:hypothetical protein